MIEPTGDDMGRAVLYTALDGSREWGVIVRFNDHGVFVRYRGKGPGAQSTRREDLEWVDGKGDK